MSVLPVKDNKVQLTETVGTVYQNGVLMAGEKATYATASPVTYSNGIQRTATGAIYCVDATAGLPAGYTWCNGLPFSILGALCISNNAVASWSNGIPFDVNGAVVADYMPTPVISLDFTSGTLDSRITFTRASGGTRVNSSGNIELLTTNTPRFDYDPVTLAAKGLLIEEQRTNLIRNNSMVGAVAGTPGTLPTNWGATLNGLTQQVIGTGTLNGIQYIDLKLSGTLTSATFSIRFDANNTIAATNNQSFTESVFLSNIAGGISNITAANIQLNQYNSVGSYISSINGGDIKSNLSAFDRKVSTLITNDASVAFVIPYLIFTSTTGSAIDITLRIGYPQLELGSFATSVIPTTTAQATRAADVAVMTGTNFSSWYSQSQGTVYAEFDNVTTSPFKVIQLDDGTNFNALFGGSNLSQVNSPSMTVTGLATYVPNVAYKSCHSYALNDFMHVVNNGTVATNNSGTPVTATTARIGSGASGQYLNGHIRAIKFYNTVLFSAQQKALTA